jgi:hypothetical protein
MPGGLMQLVGVGAQNELVNGNPSMTHFRSVYRRHTNFAMEQIRMPFTATNLEFSTTGTRTISCRVDRYAQLLNDCYLNIILPDIWSPLKNLNGVNPPAGYDARTQAIGYEFQWIPNIGYNLIDHVNLTMNGQVIQSLRGEWLKLYSYMTHDANKRTIVDQMVGNVPEVYDPAHAYDRDGQYPHAITPTVLPTASPQTKTPEPSIRSRRLIVPLHFWFCENPGMSLPLVSLQNAEVYIEVTLRQMSDLYTVVDTDSTSLTFGQRVRPVKYPMSLFLSPPLSTGITSNTTLTTWFPDPYIEGNFIYLTEMEMNQLAVADQSFLVKTVKYINKEGQFGGNTDLEIPMFNLVTRIVFASQRADRMLLNDWDNYTNWSSSNRAPWSAINSDLNTFLYSSGQQQVSSVYPRDSVIDGLILFDGKERIQTKPLPFFSLMQMYRHTTGETTGMPGVYMYSFAIDNSSYQPSGAANGSMFNKIVLRLTLQQPLPLSLTPTTSTTVCVLTSTLFSPNPTVIPAANVNLVDPQTGKLLYPPGTVTTVVQTNDNILFTFTYNVGVYVESINFFRIVSGLGNLVFAS